MDARGFVRPAVARNWILRSSPNWTAVIFFGALGFLHLSIALPAFAHRRWEGYLSLIFGIVFLMGCAVAYRSRLELAILPNCRSIRLRRGLTRLYYQRFIPYADVHAVRLTVLHPSRRRETRIELICDNEDIEFPPTSIPRQQALFLAILLGVRLIKVSDHDAPETSEAIADLAG